MAFRTAGLADRLAALLIARGYVKSGKSGHEPDVPKLMRTLGYDKQNVFNWLHGTTPDNASLAKLENDFGVPWGWLLIGEDEIKRGYRYVIEREQSAASGKIPGGSRGSPPEPRLLGKPSPGAELPAQLTPGEAKERRKRA